MSTRAENAPCAQFRHAFLIYGKRKNANKKSAEGYPCRRKFNTAIEVKARASFTDQLKKLIFTQYGYSKLLCLVKLASGLFARNNIICFFADAAGGTPAH